MPKPPVLLAIAFPVAAPHRELLQKLAPETPIPGLYRRGAKERPCASCGIHLNVGPRILAYQAEHPTLVISCPICVTAWADGAAVDVESLGNPEHATPAGVTRFEVIDDSMGGRVYTRRPCAVELSYQDGGRTLKVFVKKPRD